MVLDCVVAKLFRDLECVSSNPSQTRMKLPCFYPQFTITTGVLPFYVLQIRCQRVIDIGLYRVNMHPGLLRELLQAPKLHQNVILSPVRVIWW